MDDTNPPADPALSGPQDSDVIPPRDPDAQKRREEDIARGSALAARRSREEAAIKQRIKQRKETQAERGKESSRLTAERKEGAIEAKKEFRKEDRRRKKEIEEDKKRREEEQKKFDAYQQSIRDKRKKQQQYMKDLSEVAEMKFKREKEALTNRLTAEKARHDAEAKAQFQYNTIDHEAYRAKDEAEKSLRARRGVVEGESKKKLYKLEELKRMKLDALEAEVRSRKAAIVRRAPANTTVAENELLGFFRFQRRLIDTDSDKRRSDITAEEHTLKTQAENAYHEEVARIDAQLRAKRYQVDLELSRRLDDIAHGKL